MVTQYPVIALKPEREAHIRNKHHSIFRTAFGSIPSLEPGAIVEVQSSVGEFLCYAQINKNAYVTARIISFEKGDPLESLRRTILRSLELRRMLPPEEGTTCMRLVNAEGDCVPGLIVDQYADIIVVQISTAGMERLKSMIVEILKNALHPRAIFEKSTGAARRREGLEPTERWLHGEPQSSVEVSERGLKYVLQLSGSQKTGFFLDQREMRSLVRHFAAGRTVLDCCSYVGGFSMNALAGGALHADAVDYDATAVEQSRQHALLNGFSADRFEAFSEDVFDFLRRNPKPRPYDFIVLDPPAFAKRSTDVSQAKGAYTDMNRMALQALPPQGLLLTCSCSYQIDRDLFQTIVFHAARQAGRSVRILERHRQAFDHPVNLYHPEVDYLKSLLLWVE